MPDAKSLVDDPRWFPWHFEAHGNDIVFVRLDREDLRRAAFLDQRLDATGRRVVRAPWHSVETLLHRVPIAPATRFILHSAFCGSTLLTRSLDSLHGWTALREPLTLLSVANFRRLKAPVFQDPERWRNLLLGLLGLLARPFEAGDRAVIKPTNLANALIPDLMRHVPDVRLILMYTPLRPFLVSVLGRGPQGREFSRHLLRSASLDVPLPGLTPSFLSSLTDAQAAGLAWYLQLRQFQRYAEQAEAGRVATLEADAFYTDPASSIARVTAFFGAENEHAEIADVVNGALFQSDAKDGDAGFAPSRHRTKRREIERRLAPMLDSTVQWLEREFPDAPVRLPLARALG